MFDEVDVGLYHICGEHEASKPMRLLVHCRMSCPPLPIPTACRRCGRPFVPLGEVPFYITNCGHILCIECVRKCIVNTNRDNLTVTCPVEGLLRRIMPLNNDTPRDIRDLFASAEPVSGEHPAKHPPVTRVIEFYLSKPTTEYEVNLILTNS